MEKANINWEDLSFSYSKTDYNVRTYYRDGKWGELEVSSSDQVSIHMAASCLHYGQEAFEGMKAFEGKDGKIRVFRWEENAKRLINSARGVMMAEVPLELFKEAILKVIELNKRFIPPYGTGASLYLRPLLIGTGAQVGVSPANEYMFMVFAVPVGPYFKAGFNPVTAQIARDYDRAAPLGTGTLKVGGNYAASLSSGVRAHDEGYSACLYLDAKEKKYIDEAGPANFFGIKDKTFITPKSSSILPSITNKSLQVLAKDLGLDVEVRPVPVEELATFEETGACGTAAVISPFSKIQDRDTGEVYDYGDKPGEYSTKLYHKLQNIQNGDEPDTHDWVLIVE